MSESRSAEVQRALTARRALMKKRMLWGRVLMVAWAVLAALNLILLYASETLRLPVSCATADFLLMLHLLYPDAAGSTVAASAAMLLPILICTATAVWNKEGVGKVLRTVIFLLLWADIVLGLTAYFWNPALLFGSSGAQTALAIANLAGHAVLIWAVSRARRAVESLDILPETEIEGDPFEEFRK